MKSILTAILSLFIFFGAVPSVNVKHQCVLKLCEMSCVMR